MPWRSRRGSVKGPRPDAKSGPPAGVSPRLETAHSAIAWLPVIAAVLCALAWLTPTPAAGGWLWDLGNGLGVVAFALILVLSLEPGRSRLHRPLAWLAVGAASVHGGYLLVLDATLVEYLKPTMPPYMAAGLVALALLALSALTSGKVRRRIFPSQRAFRHLHWIFSSVVIAGSAYHVVGSAFYLNEGHQMALLAMLLVAFAAWPRFSKPTGWLLRPWAASPRSWLLARQVLAALAVASLVLVMPRNL